MTVSKNPQVVPRLSEQELRDLRCLAALMIPVSEEYGVPGADDFSIFAVIVNSLGRDTDDARAVLRCIAGVAELPPARRDEVVAALRATGGEALAILHRVVLLCYYRDDRVMMALDMEPRPPFPRGHVLEQGDWTLLEKVRKRPKIWRDAS
jgi:alkylhydroperoxidase family enzyme